MMKSDLDSDGQPLNESFNASRRCERDISEMLGLVKGILIDGKVTTDEAKLLDAWIKAHPDAVAGWPGDVIAERLQRIFADGKVTKAERTDLLELLTDLVGGKAGIIATQTAPTELPLDRPIAKIVFNRKRYVFTGKFAFGPREVCEKETMRAGGKCDSAITKSTNFLVIGTFGSRDWIQTSYGRKIEKAVSLRQKGVPIAIVSENAWAMSLPK
jgi:NAD-dependent DNA ligase